MRKTEPTFYFCKNLTLTKIEPLEAQKKYRTFVSGDGRHRSAIVITNTEIDAILIKQLSDLDTLVLELIHGRSRFLAVSMYFDIEKQIDNFQRIDEIMAFAKGIGILIAMDSNSGSNAWYDTTTNARGRNLEEYLSSNQLHIMNEESERTTFNSSRGTRNIDITPVNNQLLAKLSGWKISEEESFSDHLIIQYSVGHCHHCRNELHFYGTRYIVKEENYINFDESLAHMAASRFGIAWAGDKDALDTALSSRVTENTDDEDSVNKLHEVLEEACSKSFKKRLASKKASKTRTVPWWSEELTILRKRLNALRRRYQRTKNEAELREARKNEYFAVRRTYQATIKKQKIDSWKQYCNTTTSINPWNAVYKIATGKAKGSVPITTLQKPDGTLTSDLRETMEYMLHYFVPADDEQGETNHHKRIRARLKEPIWTRDDRDFTTEEIKRTIESLDHKKAPGEDGITSDILLRTFTTLPEFITSLFNGCFPKRWKRAKIVPIIKYGEENSLQVSKYRPISLINTGGKILEKASSM